MSCGDHRGSFRGENDGLFIEGGSHATINAHDEYCRR
jgi:hypothetical protein